MPKAMQYTKGSIVYFENDNDDRVFILQKGRVVITTTDVETKLMEIPQHPKVTHCRNQTS